MNESAFSLTCDSVRYKKRKPQGNSLEVSWQREKDSNPHKQSQSLSCYPYTIPLFLRSLAATKVIIPDLSQMSTLFSFFEKIKFFFVRPLRSHMWDAGKKRKPQGYCLEVSGSGRRIRTLTNRVRVCRATLTQSRYLFCPLARTGVIIANLQKKSTPFF